MEEQVGQSQHGLEPEAIEDFSSDRMVAQALAQYEEQLELPSLTKQVLRLAYALSLQTEEGQTPRCVIAVSDQGQTLPGEYRFAPASPCSLEVLRKLAIACDPDRACLHIRPHPRSREAALVGIGFRPSRHMDPYYADRFVVIELLSPGHIMLQVGKARVVFRKTTYLVPNATTVVRQMLPQAAINVMVERLTHLAPMGDMLSLGNAVLKKNPLLREEQYERYRVRLQDWSSVCIADNIISLARMVCRKGRGGTLIFASGDSTRVGPGPIVAGYSVERGGTSFKSEPWNCGMLDTVAWHSHYDLAKEGITVIADLCSKSAAELKEWAERVCSVFLQRALQLWAFDREFIADLTKIDGAVLLDDLHEPRVIGAKLQRGGEELPEQVREYLKGKGTRHSSAAHAVQDLGAMAIVMSQDGLVTLFDRSEPGRALTATELRL